MKNIETEFLNRERKAIIQDLLVILERLDIAGEATTAIHIDMALNLLDPSRSAGEQASKDEARNF